MEVVAVICGIICSMLVVACLVLRFIFVKRVTKKRENNIFDKLDDTLNLFQVDKCQIWAYLHGWTVVYVAWMAITGNYVRSIYLLVPLVISGPMCIAISVLSLRGYLDYLKDAK